MPLLDHFRAPLKVTHPWMGFHSSWAAAIAQHLNQGLLPEDYYALPNVQLGGEVEIDVATLKQDAARDGNVATAVWAPPQASLTMPVDFVNLEVFEVQVLQDLGGPQLRAAIEIVSPANKDRPRQRRTFAVKAASYLQRAVSVIVIDAVTERLANLHAELLQALDLDPATAWQSPSHLYAGAYRTVLAAGSHRLDAWLEPLALGQPLPTLPLWLDAERCLPLRLEDTYTATCGSLRIRGAS